MNRDLYLSGLKAHEKRMDDWRTRHVTPRSLDGPIVALAIFIIFTIGVFGWN